jgi:hypothetical protein
LICVLDIRLEPYAMKVARTVLRGGDLSNKKTYLNRPYAALLLLVIGYNVTGSSNKVVDRTELKYLYSGCYINRIN